MTSATLLRLTPAAAALVLFGTLSPADGADVAFVPGDILVGFQASGGVGAGSVYVFNLGQGHLFRDAGAAVDVFNAGADLSSTFGSGWFARTDLTWAIGGVRTNAAFGAAATQVIEGDPARTLYVSRGAATPGASDAWFLPSAPTVTIAATEMIDVQSGFATVNGVIPREATPGSDNRGVVQSTGDINNWSLKVDAAPFGVFTSGVQGTFGQPGSVAVLDLYRILGRNDLEGIAESAPVGQGVYQGSFTIDAQGAIRFEIPGSGGGGEYDDWADSFELAGTDREAAADPDGDGVPNVLEYLTAGDPGASDAGAILPAVSAGVGAVSVDYRRAAAAADGLNPRIETATTLAGPWIAAANGVDGVSIVEKSDHFGSGIDRVTVSFPTSGGPVRFFRLAVDLP